MLPKEGCLRTFADFFDFQSNQFISKYFIAVQADHCALKICEF